VVLTNRRVMSVGISDAETLNKSNGPLASGVCGLDLSKDVNAFTPLDG